MLLNLSIKDLVLIDTLHLSVEKGLSVLTGETGAGKSILLDALSLALGMRGDVSLIRQGAEQAIVSAEFYIKDHQQLIHLLDEHGLGNHESVDTIVFRRILSRQGTSTGRSRAFINDQMVSVGLLRLLGDALLEIHGQFDRLLDPSSYRSLLDEFAKATLLRDQVQENFHTWQQAYQRWQETEHHLTNLRQNEGLLKQQIEDLKQLKALPGEEESLLQERNALSHVGKISEAIKDASTHLHNPSIESAIHSTIKVIQRIQGQGDQKVEAAISALERAETEIIEANALIQDLSEQLANHPQRLQEIDERLYVLRAAARKFNVMSDALGELLEKRSQELLSLDQASELLAEHAKATSTAQKIYCEAAQKLRQCRLDAAQLLEQAVMAELPALMLPQSQFKVQVTELDESQWSENGMDRIDFMVAMNKGQDFCSLSKSASGGELARLMLALKVSLASRSSIPTIIFDEIDTGVGGAVASAIGERLAKLAQSVQVLSITHSPQVAAYANTHFMVFKEDLGSFMRTSVRCLTMAERQEELARMLSGAEITTEAQAAALRLLNVR